MHETFAQSQNSKLVLTENFKVRDDGNFDTLLPARKYTLHDIAC